jgi:hypothetical protein
MGRLDAGANLVVESRYIDVAGTAVSRFPEPPQRCPEEELLCQPCPGCLEPAFGVHNCGRLGMLPPCQVVDHMQVAWLGLDALVAAPERTVSGPVVEVRLLGAMNTIAVPK